MRTGLHRGQLVGRSGENRVKLRSAGRAYKPTLESLVRANLHSAMGLHDYMDRQWVGVVGVVDDVVDVVVNYYAFF